MERPFSTVNYLKLSDITEEDIKTLEKYKKDLEKICNWASSKRACDIEDTRHFKVELKRVNKFLSKLDILSETIK